MCLMKLGISMKKINDYRLTSYRYETDYYDVISKKESFVKEFRVKHPRTNDFFSVINQKKNQENKRFREMYSFSCVYCGVDIKVIDSSRFEVDHFIPQHILNDKIIPAYLKKEDVVTINNVNNLVCSCYYCNRWKSGFYCEKEENCNLLHPDNNMLSHIFSRASNYEISINQKYKLNEDIISLYKSLRLGDHLRRIDFFLMELNDFLEALPKDNELYLKVSDLLRKLERKKKIGY